MLQLKQDAEMAATGMNLEGLAIDVLAAQHVSEIYDEMRDEGMISADDMADLEVEEIKVRVIASEYVRHYGIDQRREIEFLLPLRNPRTKRPSRTFQLGGKIDGAVVVGPHRVKMIEDKLVSTLQRSMIQRLPLDHQTTEYVDAFAAKGWSAEVSYRHTRWPGISPKPPRQYKKKDDYPGETLPEFEERLRLDIAGRIEYYFDEQVLWFPTAQLEEYRAERWQVAQDILTAKRSVGKPTELQVFYRSPAKCWEYGGCSFIPLCTKQAGAEALYVETEDNVELSRELVEGKEEGNGDDDQDQVGGATEGS